MRRRQVALWVVPLLCGVLLQTDAVTTAQTKDPLQSFYIVRFFVSDYVSAWNHTFLDLTPVGNDVRVRLVRMALANPNCDALEVRALERVFPRTTVAKVAGTDVCSNTEEAVDAALTAAKRAAGITEAASQVVVAKCGVKERAFWFPYDVMIDDAVLQRSSPAVASLGAMLFRMQDAAFGKSLWFNRAATEQELDLGLKLVPELMSGKYNAAFAGWTCFDQPDKKCVPNYLAWRLKGYRRLAPGAGGMRPPELVEQASLHLTKYVAPTYPLIAMSARVQGDVHLSVTADSQTGAVTQVDVVKGPPLISAAAAEAAGAWQFAPAFLTGQPIEATVRFELRCRGE